MSFRRCRLALHDRRARSPGVQQGGVGYWLRLGHEQSRRRLYSHDLSALAIRGSGAHDFFGRTIRIWIHSDTRRRYKCEVFVQSDSLLVHLVNPATSQLRSHRESPKRYLYQKRCRKYKQFRYYGHLAVQVI